MGLLILPVLLTVTMYIMLLCTLNPQATAGDATSIQMAVLSKMTHGIVIGLVVCNVPGLAFMAYLNAMLKQGRMDDLFKSNTAV